MSPAHGRCGARATMNNNSPSVKKSGEARKQAGKKDRLGEGISARPRFLILIFSAAAEFHASFTGAPFGF